jgi:hypothetical protein
LCCSKLGEIVFSNTKEKGGVQMKKSSSVCDGPFFEKKIKPQKQGCLIYI